MNEENIPQLDHLELIDATQNAVIEAVDNVSELISETTEETAVQQEHHEVFYKEAEFWVGFAFILVVVFLFRPVSRMARQALLKRRDDIADEIKSAEKLHDDAQNLWAEYERRFLNAEREASEILQKSQNQIDALYREETAKFESEYRQKTRDAEQAVTAARARFLDEINALTAQNAVRKAASYLATHLDSKQHTQLIDESVERILKDLKS